jgi:hypothetical protein
MFEFVLCVPASSAPVERIFSQSGLLLRPHRAKMTNNLLETLVFLKCNSVLVVVLDWSILELLNNHANRLFCYLHLQLKFCSEHEFGFVHISFALHLIIMMSKRHVAIV